MVLNQKRGGKYKKPQQDVKEKIISQLKQKTKTVKQLAQEYDIPPSTIKSYLKAKGPMYKQFKTDICQKIEGFLCMPFQRINNNQNGRFIRKVIKKYIIQEQFLVYQDINPFLSLIPKEKKDSKRLRPLNEILTISLKYYTDQVIQQANLIETQKNLQQGNQQLYGNQEIELQIDQSLQTQDHDSVECYLNLNDDNFYYQLDD